MHGQLTVLVASGVEHELRIVESVAERNGLHLQVATVAGGGQVEAEASNALIHKFGVVIVVGRQTDAVLGLDDQLRIVRRRDGVQVVSSFGGGDTK